MADFEFYTQVYLGSLIPQKAFDGAALRAKEALERLQRIYQVLIPGEDSLKLAICAMAEAVYLHDRHRGGMTAASVGQVSVRYEGGHSAGKTLQRQLYEKASIYLDIRRGVSG